jgi:FXSXX-COOH protein
MYPLKGARMDEDAFDSDGWLIDVSGLSLADLADELDESTLTHTLRRLFVSYDTDSDVFVTGFQSAIGYESELSLFSAVP